MEPLFAGIYAFAVCLLYLLIELWRTSALNRRIEKPLAAVHRDWNKIVSNRRIKAQYAEIYKYHDAYSGLTEEELAYRQIALRSYEGGTASALLHPIIEAALGALLPVAAFALGAAVGCSGESDAWTWEEGVAAAAACVALVAIYAAFRTYRRSKIKLHLLIVDEVRKARAAGN